ncbi:MAG: hypothetical protein J6J04_05915 [Oscillospiraceae bacterium]|nr:hypothetical protein [Oscillospiraceae bacterium]
MKDFVLDSMRRQGRLLALDLQSRAGDMKGTELYAESDYIPDFKEAVKVKNMMERTADMKNGFVCKSSAGLIVRLIQNYDSDTFTAEPEDLPAQYGYVWSNDPKKALPFVSLATSPYHKGNCCIENDTVFRSKIGNNIHAPSAYPEGWEAVE